VRIGVGGKISSIKERRPALIDELKKKIEKTKRIIKSLATKAPGSDKTTPEEAQTRHFRIEDDCA